VATRGVKSTGSLLFLNERWRAYIEPLATNLRVGVTMHIFVRPGWSVWQSSVVRVSLQTQLYTWGEVDRTTVRVAPSVAYTYGHARME
jgi:hypothetical protein